MRKSKYEVNLDELAEKAGYRLNVMAELCGGRVRQLRNIIRREKGKSPREWFKELRLAKGKTAMQEQDMNVKEASDVANYGHARNFSRAYKAFYGQSPSQVIWPSQQGA